MEKIPRFMASKVLDMLDHKDMSKTEFIRMCIAHATRKGYSVKPSPQYLYKILDASIQPSDMYLKLFAEVLDCKINDMFGEVTLKVKMKG